jgi:hypothetical protein
MELFFNDNFSYDDSSHRIQLVLDRRHENQTMIRFFEQANPRWLEFSSQEKNAAKSFIFRVWRVVQNAMSIASMDYLTLNFKKLVDENTITLVTSI